MPDLLWCLLLAACLMMSLNGSTMSLSYGQHWLLLLIWSIFSHLVCYGALITTLVCRILSGYVIRMDDVDNSVLVNVHVS